MKNMITATLTLLGFVLASPLPADESVPAVSNGLKVKITRSIDSIQVEHDGRPVTIRRNQDTKHRIRDAFAKTSRPCPPFCIQPLTLAPGVETIGERKMLEYLQQASSDDDKVLVIDSRTRKWVKRGTIPGSVNIPYKLLTQDNEEEIADLLEERFGVHRGDTLLDFSYAKTLVLFCNGLWCGQAPTNIRKLLRLGYPPHKLKYYRGGMQAWESLGLTTVKPDA